jgi:simple sugar transport system permease protein
MTSFPYLATILVLVLVSRTRGKSGAAAPACLGTAFVPER